MACANLLTNSVLYYFGLSWLTGPRGTQVFYFKRKEYTRPLPTNDEVATMAADMRRHSARGPAGTTTEGDADTFVSDDASGSLTKGGAKSSNSPTSVLRGIFDTQGSSRSSTIEDDTPSSESFAVGPELLR
jgi:hypothetical protein